MRLEYRFSDFTTKPKRLLLVVLASVAAVEVNCSQLSQACIISRLYLLKLELISSDERFFSENLSTCIEL